MATALGIVSYNDSTVYVQGLQQHRPIASFSFLGRYRLVDVPVSNMTNSGMDDIEIYVNGNPRSLFDHIGDGRQYNINSKHGSLCLIPLYKETGLGTSIYTSDVESYYDNIDNIIETKHDYVIIAPVNYIYTTNYAELLQQHIESGADISMLYKTVNDANEKYINCDTLALNKQKGVEGIELNVGRYKKRDLSLLTYIMKKDIFVSLIEEARKVSRMYWLKDIINDKCAELDIRAIAHRGKVYCINDLKSYFDANMDILSLDNMKEFSDPKWPIYTNTSDTAPVVYIGDGTAQQSLISNGSQISGTVKHSIVGRSCKIGKGAIIENCVITEDVEIGPNAILQNVIVDKHSKIIHKKELVGQDYEPLYIGRREKI